MMEDIIPTIVNVKDNYQPQQNDVYIGRGSKWGNIFRIGPDGTREEVIEKFRRYAAARPHIINSLPELYGKRLVCYCKPEACHGDILIEMIRSMNDGK